MKEKVVEQLHISTSQAQQYSQIPPLDNQDFELKSNKLAESHHQPNG